MVIYNVTLRGISYCYSKLAAGEKVDFPPNSMGMGVKGSHDFQATLYLLDLFFNSIVVSLSSLRNEDGDFGSGGGDSPQDLHY